MAKEFENAVVSGGKDRPVQVRAARKNGWTKAKRAIFLDTLAATFEVFADAGAVGVGAIAEALADEVDADVALAFDGFAASGGSVRAVLETLAGASGAWFAPIGTRLAMRDSAGAVAAIADDGVTADGRGARHSRAVAAIDTVPKTIIVSHYDAARDYQTGLQRARRPGPGTRNEQVEVPAVIGAGLAKGIAEAMLARAEAGRVTRTVAIGFAGMAIAPGACVAIEGESDVWRVADAGVERMVTTLGLVPLTGPMLPANAGSGRVSGAIDETIGATILHAVELPALDDAVLTSPRLTVIAAGEGAGWRQAALLYSLDEGASWIAAGGTAAPAIVGTVAIGADATTDALFDTASAIEVVLARPDMVLADADDAALDSGANLAIAGGEMIQFGRAEPIAPGRWRLTRLLRARRGTPGGFAPGDRFALIEADAARIIDLPLTALGHIVRVMASGVGDVAGPALTTALIGGTSVLPPAPVHLAYTIDGSGAALVSWVRRSRAGWRWIDGVDAPIAEESESYLVTIEPASAAARSIETGIASIAVTAAERAGGRVRVTVSQTGTYGRSPAATIDIPAI